MKIPIIAMFALPFLLGCSTNKKVTETTIAGHNESEATIAGKSSLISSAEISNKNDIIDNIDLIYEFVRYDLGEYGKSQDSICQSPSARAPAITKGRFIANAQHRDNSTTEITGEAKVEGDMTLKTSGQSDIESHQYSLASGLSLWDKLQIWGFRIILAAAALLIISRKLKIRHT